MGETAIRVEGLSKAFKTYDHPSDLFRELITRTPRHRDSWALRDISFSIGRGEVVGLIGRNGAGKSTLLKIITGTLDASSGTAEITGKVSALLELGTGFNPEYTGLENVYTGGLCLGMGRAEIDRKLDAIVEFSELAAFINQPLKTYSTGMQARLAFAVAVSVEPEIFVIDEALSVGDVLFQEKCFKRIREIASSGATVIFVTHSYPLIYELCDRGLLLHKGRLLLDDVPKKVGFAYEKLIAEERGQRPLDVSMGSGAAPATEGAEATPGAEVTTEARVLDAAILNDEDVEVGTLFHPQTYTVRIRCQVFEDVPSVSIGYFIQKPTGQVLYRIGSMYANQTVSARAGDVIEARFSLPCRLGTGQFLLSAAISVAEGTNYRVAHILRESRVLSVVSDGLFGGDVDLQSELLSVKVAPNAGAVDSPAAVSSAL
jgi:ABC-type polysaccharide/polyol phosphate transport system ATPase subunit